MTKKKLQAEVLVKLKEMADYYGVPSGVPDRIKDKVKIALASKDESERTVLINKVYKSMEVFALSEWAKGKASGPRTPEYLEKQAKKVEGLAKLLDSKGDHKHAQAQRKKAAFLREEADSLSKLIDSQQSGQVHGDKILEDVK